MSTMSRAVRSLSLFPNSLGCVCGPDATLKQIQRELLLSDIVVSAGTPLMRDCPHPRNARFPQQFEEKRCAQRRKLRSAFSNFKQESL
jgi:hypothetical protein